MTNNRYTMKLDKRLVSGLFIGFVVGLLSGITFMTVLSVIREGLI